VGAEFYVEGQTDRQTDMTQLIVAFRNFANAPKSIAYQTATARTNMTKKYCTDRNFQMRILAREKCKLEVDVY
jgi:hypothetical protein